MRVLGIRPDVFLDERRECGLRQVLVPINSGIDEQIDGIGVPPRVLEA
jgi:hypothetical protein